MRLTAAGSNSSSSSSSSFSTSAHRAPDTGRAQSQALALPPRERTPDGALLSLAEAPAVHGSRSLEDALRQYVAPMLGAHIPPLVVSQWKTAVLLILALDERDQTPDANPAICQMAAEILLDLDQARLLCRLALLNRSVGFAFEVGLDVQRAEALARVGDSWPPDVAVSLTLDTGLHAEALVALHAFVKGLARLSLHVKADDKVDEQTSYAMHQVFGTCSLEALSLDIDAMSLVVLQDLCGIKAFSICIVAAPPMSDAGSSTASDSVSDAEDQEELEEQEDEEDADEQAQLSRFMQQQIAKYQEAAVELVRRSGAQVLRLPQSHLDDALSARLLATRSDWDTVEFSMDACVAILDRLTTGQPTVGRLELQSWAPANVTDMSYMLALAAKIGVHSLVFHDAVNLRDIAYGLGNHLLLSTHTFERIEACFVVGEDDQLIGKHFDEQVVEPLLSNPMVQTLRHKPLLELPGAPSFSPEGVPIGANHIASLNTVSALNRLVSPEEHLARVQRVVEEIRREAIHELGFCLSREGDASGLVDGLLCLRVAFVNPPRDAEEAPRFDQTVKGMFDALEWFGVEAWLIKAAVAQCVRDHPTMGPQLARGVMGSKLPLRQRKPEEWMRLGAPYAKSWLVEDDIQRLEAKSSDIVDLIAPPVHPDPNVAVPESLTPASVVPDSKVGADQAPVLAVLPAQTAPISLVTPSSQQMLDRLTADFEDLADEQEAQTSAALATGIILRLLDNGAFNPAHVLHASVGRDLAKQLLEKGQGRMLKHIIDRSSLPFKWTLDIGDAVAAKALLDLRPWRPDARCGCTLQLHVDLSAGDGAHVVDFAKTVNPTQLTLSMPLQKHAAPEVLEDIIRLHPGLELSIGRGGKAIDIDAAEALLSSVKSTPLGVLDVIGVDSDDTRLVNALVRLIVNTRVKRLQLGDCSPGLTQTILTHQRWEMLNAWTAGAAQGVFASGMVSAEKLQIAIKRMEGAAANACVEAMVANCKDVTTLRIESRWVSALALARGLDRNRSVRMVQAELNALNEKELTAALTLLRRNTSLMYFDFGDSTVPRWFQQAVRGLVTRNRLRHPDLAAIGAGMGFGVRVGGLVMRDVFAHIGSMLGPDDTVALSLVNKAAYIASRRPWEIEIDRLANLFAIESPDQFKADLVRQLGHLHKKFAAMSGRVPSGKTPASTLLEKVLVMQSAGVPDFAIGEALRRALKANPISSHAYLEAMVTVGAYPAEVWLKDIAGIDVKGVDAPQTSSSGAQ